MHKKTYIQPKATIIAFTENESYLLITSGIDMGGEGTPDAKERIDFEDDESETSFGDLW